MIMNKGGPTFLCASGLAYYAQMAPFFLMNFKYKLVYLQLPKKAHFLHDGHIRPNLRGMDVPTRQELLTVLTHDT